MTRFDRVQLNDSPDILNYVSVDNIKMRAATESDAAGIIEFFHQFPEVSFCPWQDLATTQNILKSHTSVVFLAEAEDEIVGVVMGGLMGSRATINHLAIDPMFQKFGIASQLVSHVKSVLRQKGIHRMFLFVHKNNDAGLQFWTKQGLNQTSDEVTLEMDI
ncbi:GNAT family N-acetyltransferase [Photobacterium sp. GJ3]|uniref:GNAT family N-acetyltransferase n=1 Tax=Photobacterium sp. GJ3 TaxID=2829502 RepID=UPI001B8D4170|nr:GNAT family N-acetyltransferase [Photobacterium sp. GJ3]QUJ66599.1 GNAT family N-acetyltransferase [Photobacterium sp. GJ3]